MLRRTFAGALAVAVFGARAQSDPTIRLVVPFPPGGATDMMARMLVAKLSVSLGQPVIVENKAGAAGSLGSDHVAKSTPDGRTLLLGTLSTHGTNPVLPTRTPYHPVNSFTPLTLVAVSPLVFIAHPDVPARTLQEFVRFAQAKPGVPYASNGLGSYNHLATELLQSTAGMRLLHVPYKGAAEVMNAVASGNVQFAAADLAGATPLMQSKRVRPLAVASRSRVPGFEDLPTVAESGYADFQVDVWYALFGPAGMSEDQIARIHSATVKAVTEPDFKARLTAVGTLVQTEAPAQLRERIVKENVRWSSVARNAVLE